MEQTIARAEHQTRSNDGSIGTMREDGFLAQCLSPRVRNLAVWICPDSADMHKLCANGCGCSCDVLCPFPLDCFELCCGALQYTHQGDDGIRILKRLGKGFSLGHVNWHRRQKVVLWKCFFQFRIDVTGVSG